MIGAVKQPKFRRSGPIPEANDRLNMCRRIRKNNLIGEFKNDRPTAIEKYIFRLTGPVFRQL